MCICIYYIHIIYIYTYVLYIIYVYIYIIHIYKIHSSVDGHLGCFHVLMVVNSVAVNIGVNVSFQISVFVFLGYISRNGFAGSYGSSSFNFLRNSTLFSIMVSPIYISTNSIHGFPFLLIIANICCALSF